MKKLLLPIFALLLLGACASVKEAQQTADCKFTLRSVEIAEYNVTSISFDVTIGITNLSRKQAAAIKRFEGKLDMNDQPIADVSLKDVRVEPNTTKNAKAHIVVPMSSFNSKLLGLVSMGSGTVDYHLTGTMYLEGPLGAEVPVPVDIGRLGSYN